MLEPISFLNLTYSVVTIEGDSVFISRAFPMPTSASPKARQEFDYASLDAETYRFVKQQTGEIRVLMKRTVESIFEIGQRLIAVKERLGHGRFGLWLASEFEWSQDTANNFINVVKKFGQTPKFSDFDMAASALYILSAPSTPEAARTEALTRAKAGESITYTAAKAIKQKYATPTTPKLELPQPESKPSPQPPLIPAPFPQSGSKLEIVAIHRQAQPPALEADPVPTVLQAFQSVSQADVPGVWWQLGGKHLLYCGDPNSSEFLGRVTAKVPLLLAFPSLTGWLPTIPAKTYIISTEYLPQNRSLDQIDENLESNILFHSNLGDLVINCFLPTPEILSIINRLERKGALAEPDPKRCNAVITDWKKAGLKVERLS